MCGWLSSVRCTGLGTEAHGNLATLSAIVVCCVVLSLRWVQASLSISLLFAAYIAHQRMRPFVSAETLSSSLQERLEVGDCDVVSAWPPVVRFVPVPKVTRSVGTTYHSTARLDVRPRSCRSTPRVASHSSCRS
jgi:hypothetical protein